jgi:hypothetical protein
MTWFRNLQMMTKLIVGFAMAALITKAVEVVASLAGSVWTSAAVHLLGAAHRAAAPGSGARPRSRRGG